MIAAGAFAERARAEKRAAQLGGRVASVAATGPSGAVPAWGLAGAGRIDGLVGAIDVRGERVVTWSAPESTGWRLGADALTLETAATTPLQLPLEDADTRTDPLTAQRVANPIGLRLPGMSAPFSDRPPAAVLRYDDRRDQLQAVESAAGAERILWTLPLDARERLVQVFPRRGGVYLRFDGTLFLLRRTVAGAAGAAPGPRLGKLCGKLTSERKSARNGTVVLPAPASAEPLRLDTTDGSFELWAPVPSMVEPVADLSTFRCARDETAGSDAPTGGLLTELGARVDIEITCE